MPIIVCGLNYKSAPIALREKVIFPLEKLGVYLSDLATQENIQDAVLLSTCNRSEIYCDASSAEQIVAWFCRQHEVSADEVKSVLYIYEDQQALEHIMQVACGLDSMILGESQILGQMKTAFSESCAAGTISPLFNRLFQQVFVVAKEVRSNTAIGACPVSVASTAVNLAKQLCGDFTNANVLVVGAGDTAELVLRYLQVLPLKKLSISNRNRANAAILAKKYGAHIVSFKALTSALTVADVVITATGSTLPIISKAMVQTAFTKRNTGLTIIDIAMPRDVDASVAELPAVELRCIDDLKMMIQHNLRGREHAADKAREVIHQKVADFISWSQSLALVATTISAYRRQIEEISRTELLKAARQLKRGDDPAAVLASFANALTKKLLHSPSVQLRQAGVEGRVDILQLAQQLFAIHQVEPDLL
jgi:glutamyl-tRNA reductase